MSRFVRGVVSSVGRVDYFRNIRHPARLFKCHHSHRADPDRLAVVGYSKGAQAGFTLTRSGTIDVSDTALRTALGANLSGIQALFGAAGIGNAMVTATGAASRAVDGTITSAVTTITDSNTRLNKRVRDLQARVEARREALVARFTSMELAISRFQAQGNSLQSSIAGSTRSR